MNNAEEAEKIYNEGVEHYNKKEYDKAIECFTKAIELDENYVFAYNYRGVAYGNKGEYDEAIKDYTEAIKINPSYAFAYNNRGVAYGDKSDYTQAIKDYDKAIELKSDNADAYNNRGNAYDSKGEYDEAINDYTEAIRLNPSYALAYNNRGLTYVKKNEYDLAIKDYNEAIRLNPNNAYAYNRTQAYDAKIKKIAESVAKPYKEELETLKKDLNIDEFKAEAQTHLAAIEKKHEYINTAHEDITKKVFDANNHKLAKYYQEKSGKLKRQLSGFVSLKPFKFLGFIQWFWMLLLLIVAGLLIAGNELSENIKNISWLGLALHSIKYTPALILSVWGVRYFNRRIHETVHLIEEYENKAIILMSFDSYSERLKSLGGDDKEALLKYTEKVSHIITESPTYALHRKKTDKIPIEFLQLMSYQNKSTPVKPSE